MLTLAGVPSSLRRLLAGAALAFAASACGGSSLERPPFAPQPRDGWQRVTFPPPPVLVQGITKPPAPEGYVWVDGHWRWATRDWEWVPGGWVRPEPGARYAKAAMTRLADGALLYAPGRWLGVKAKANPQAPVETGPTKPCPCDSPADATAVRETTTSSR